MARNSSGPSISCSAGVRPSNVCSRMERARPASARCPGRLGREVAGGQGVDPHPAIAPLGGQPPGEIDQGALGGVVGGHRAAAGDDAVPGGDVDNAGGGSNHQQPGGQPARVHDADQVDFDDPAQVSSSDCSAIGPSSQIPALLTSTISLPSECRRSASACRWCAIRARAARTAHRQSADGISASRMRSTAQPGRRPRSAPRLPRSPLSPQEA